MKVDETLVADEDRDCNKRLRFSSVPSRNLSYDNVKLWQHSGVRKYIYFGFFLQVKSVYLLKLSFL